MGIRLGSEDRLGLLRPTIDAHTLGLSSVEQLASECGIRVVIAEAALDESIGREGDAEGSRALRDWIKAEGITALGFSYRLDPDDGLRIFANFVRTLRLLRAFAEDGGLIRALYFAGLPRSCDLVEEHFPWVAATFRGDEGPARTLDLLGIPRSLLPARAAASAAYDEERMAFGRELVREGGYRSIRPVDRSGSPRYGERGDTAAARIAHGSARGLPPLMRAHVGPYLPHRREAFALFLDWTRRLAKEGLLDVLSIGTSQLSQSDFWGNWEGKDDGGGVPIATAEEFAEVWRAARPMLVRSYAGTRNVRAMAHILEDSIDIAWHALSLWWFCRIDGRGPNTVMENLVQHRATLEYAARTGKPYEPNVPHHFAFRGGDDLSYVLSGLVAAKAAKAAGVRQLVLQVMLNTPKYSWGINDLAKARALLDLVRELEDGSFKVFLQPRGGLDYFSGDPETAKAQLAAVTAMMDDIEPGDAGSPQIIHVVSYSEGFALADPDIVDESIRITRQALSSYRALRSAGKVRDMSTDPRALERRAELARDAKAAIAAIESSIPAPYEPKGLYEIMASGFFAVPFLSEGREEFAQAVKWRTKCVDGAIVVVDEAGLPIPAADRMAAAADAAKLRGKAAR
jgi:hypothetical protein